MVTNFISLLLLIFKTIEKSEFCVLIKHCFLMGKIQFKQSNGLISVIQTLLRRKQRLRGCMLTLNAVEQTQMMLNAKVAQIWQLSRKTPKEFHKRVLADCKWKLREIVRQLNISEGSEFTILHEHLSMRKLCSKWVSRFLTVDQKQCVNYSERCFQLFQRNKKEFLSKYVTMGETWIHHFTPETNRLSAEWTAASESRPKRPKTEKTSAGKVLASVFWDAQDIFFIDYLEKGSTINSEYYIALLVRLKE